MIDITAGKSEGYSSEDFESAAQRLLGKRYQLLKKLNATTAQICTAFYEEYLGGELLESDENLNDIDLMLNVSTDIDCGPGYPLCTDLQPEKVPLPRLPLHERLISHTPPDRGIFWWKNRIPKPD